MRAIKGYWPYILAAAFGALVIVLAEPLSRWIEDANKKTGTLAIGRITQADGHVQRSHGGQQEAITTPLMQPVQLFDGDRVQTPAGSRATIVLNSQDEIELKPETVLEFQLWNPRDSASPIYINSLAGAFTSKRSGVKNKAYMVKDGRLYLPGQVPEKKAMALTVLRNAPLDLKIHETARGGGSKSDFEADTTLPEPEIASPASTADPETLSNEYIDETILGHQAQMQKCWLSRLKDAPTLKGQIVVQFEISKRGKVKDMRLADSTLNDEVLQRCVMSVIERITFRPFKGSEISLSYPIKFE